MVARWICYGNEPRLLEKETNQHVTTGEMLVCTALVSYCV